MRLMQTLHCWRVCAGLLTVGLISSSAQLEAQEFSTAAQVVTANAPVEHSLQPVIRYARGIRDKVDDIRDYTAVFAKLERHGNDLEKTIINIKFRTEPFSVYMKFVKPHKGREVIYVDGKNGGNLLAHETGFKSLAGTLSLNPTGSRAMKGNRHPITEFGMGKMVDILIDIWEADLKHDDVRVRYFPNAKIGTRECKVIQTWHPEPKPGIQFHMTRLFIDNQTKLPIRVQQLGFPTEKGGEPPIIEDYTYTQIRTNVGLRNIDFDTRNPKYDY